MVKFSNIANKYASNAMSALLNIPLLDLNEFVSGDEQSKSMFSKKLGAAYENIGFVAIKNHGLTDELVEKIYAETRNFFNLPLSVKQKYEIKALSGQRGYTSFGVEHAKGSAVGDLKEFWHFGQVVDDGDPIGNT